MVKLFGAIILTNIQDCFKTNPRKITYQNSMLCITSQLQMIKVDLEFNFIKF